MSRLYRPLCISILQKNNSIFDRFFTNILPCKSPLPLLLWNLYVFGKLCLLSQILPDSIKLYSQVHEENSNNISLVLRRRETRLLCQSHNLTTTCHWKAVATDLFSQVTYRPCNWTRLSQEWPQNIALSTYSHGHWTGCSLPKRTTLCW